MCVRAHTHNTHPRAGEGAGEGTDTSRAGQIKNHQDTGQEDKDTEKLVEEKEQRTIVKQKSLPVDPVPGGSHYRFPSNLQGWPLALREKGVEESGL